MNDQGKGNSYAKKVVVFNKQLKVIQEFMEALQLGYFHHEGEQRFLLDLRCNLELRTFLANAIFVNRFDLKQYLLWNSPSIFSRCLVVLLSRGAAQRGIFEQPLDSIVPLLYQNVILRFEIQCLLFQSCGGLFHPIWSLKTIRIKANLVPIDAKFCSSSTHIIINDPSPSNLQICPFLNQNNY